jgi:F-type H+-transporting ATPase subunit gamma
LSGQQYPGWRRSNRNDSFCRLEYAAIYQNANTVPLENETQMYVVSSSDRGLCGGIHSSVAKATRRLIAAPEGKANGIVVLGDRAKNQMSRSNRADIQMSFNQIGRAIPTFAEASAAADTILSSDIKFDTATIVFNEFKSAIAYEATPLRSYSINALKASGTYFILPCNRRQHCNNSSLTDLSTILISL